MDSIQDNGISRTVNRGFLFQKGLPSFSYEDLSQQIFIYCTSIDISCHPLSRHICNMFFVLLFITICPNILHICLFPLLSCRILSPHQYFFSFSHSTYRVLPFHIFWYSFSDIYCSISFCRLAFYRDQGRVFENII
ncbi:hypothetical protein L873DRAFT_113865 [Choiromyces venosus 120613-1]|uniref:Uncharacterized protein n=1 Tax=Choiromyces venosus 120613-1 TaxID=1336337 RepID=A0A3N4J4J5_9PEZI|nr:hypothetical protein L873DRAFT_113865 [Choiromyces venosus 120613-1]